MPIVRNKTFLFADFDGGLIRRESTSVSTLPAASVREGQFSKAITDPLTKQPFSNNLIPQGRLDPVALRILSYLPLPQTSDATRNFTYNNPSDQDVRKWDAKVDHVFSPSQTLYVRASSQRVENKASSPLPPTPTATTLCPAAETSH